MPFRRYLDEHIPKVLALRLREAGFDVLTTDEARHKSTDDEDQLAFANEEGRVVLTFDSKDYVPLVLRWARERREHAGVLLSPESGTNELYQRLLPILHQHTPETMHNLTLWI